MRKVANVFDFVSRYFGDRPEESSADRPRMPRLLLVSTGFVNGVVCAAALLGASAAVGSGFGGL